MGKSWEKRREESAPGYVLENISLVFGGNKNHKKGGRTVDGSAKDTLWENKTKEGE